MTATLTLSASEALAFATNTKRPKENQQGIVVNSFLKKEEWAAMDNAVLAMVALRMNILADLRRQNLVQPVSFATMLSQWRVGSERTAATVSMDGRTAGDRDRTDKKVYGVPVPIIHAEYSIGRRELLASRTLGSSLDTTEAAAAAAAVIEKAEQMVVSGQTDVVISGSTVHGLTSHSGRETGTAASYGGGDFGTISNILPTFLGGISAMAAKRYHGPFQVYIAPTQYIQMLARYTDGSGQNALDSVLRLPQITEVKASDFLTDGHAVMVQMTPNVIDLLEGGGVENREWVSPDGQELFFKVMYVVAPRVKVDYEGNLGICHITGC